MKSGSRANPARSRASFIANVKLVLSQIALQASCEPYLPLKCSHMQFLPFILFHNGKWKDIGRLLKIVLFCLFSVEWAKEVRCSNCFHSDGSRLHLAVATRVHPWRVRRQPDFASLHRSVRSAMIVLQGIYVNSESLEMSVCGRVAVRNTH